MYYLATLLVCRRHDKKKKIDLLQKSMTHNSLSSPNSLLSSPNILLSSPNSLLSSPNSLLSSPNSLENAMLRLGDSDTGSWSRPIRPHPLLRNEEHAGEEKRRLKGRVWSSPR
ncbi:hypothetical protein JYU34_012063 [Plutella xylostella]|uniref:Uncharacterized protein n=1 Tax=Plutella xylostella TaxID=51655 RepID=A0ABQ7QED3_PLUXY|nr:hypothetical protein JYU34_012063 [Plutella xylostella]